ncbi:MAG TPA: dihydrofolate reductase family protein [Bryobacteraceae bacterium]|nr:dihydrofolate reductase family protein [Bryobacteraceae bacterium]
MRRIRYSVVASLDGFIAGPNGEHDWIRPDPDFDFGALFKQFDTILAGRGTFEPMAAAGRTSMPGMKTIVISKTLRQEDYPDVTIIPGIEPLSNLKSAPGKDIWLFGGGSLFRSLATAGLVDTVELSIQPVLLGVGIPLAPHLPARIHLSLASHSVRPSGVVSLEYAIRPTSPESAPAPSSQSPQTAPPAP